MRRGQAEPDIFGELERAERSLRSKAGARTSFEQAYNRERWAREFAKTTDYAAELATLLEARLGEVWPDLDAIALAFDGVSTVAETAEGARLSGDAAGYPSMVYRFFGERDQLLYVGITDRGPTRWAEHARTKRWWPQVRGITIEPCQDRADALHREAHAIKAERPLFNIIHAAAFART